MPWWRQLIWSILFVAMATTATCGNLIVIWIVMSHRRMRTVTNYFIGKKSHFLSNFQTYCIVVVRIVHKIGEKNVLHAKLELIAAPPISQIRTNLIL